MRTLMILFCSMIITLTLSISYAEPSARIPTQPKSEQSLEQLGGLNLHFVIKADQGEMKNASQRGSYLLMVKDPVPYIGYYSNRPHRLTGIVPLLKFVQAWKTGKNSFKENPPNAILIPGQIDDVHNTNESTFMMTITDIGYQMANHALLFLVRPIRASQPFLYQEIKFNDLVLIVN